MHRMNLEIELIMKNYLQVHSGTKTNMYIVFCQTEMNTLQWKLVITVYVTQQDIPHKYFE